MISTAHTKYNDQRFPRFGLRTIMLLVAATATWTAYFSGRASIQRDTVAIEAMHTLAPQLLVRQSDEYACLRNERIDFVLFDHFLDYQCYLPEGHKYELNLAWSQPISLFENPSKPELSKPIAAGKHLISLRQLPDRLVVTVDGQEYMNVPRQRPVIQSNTSMGADTRFQTQWYPLEKPLTLVRLLEGEGGPTNNLRPGIAMWIDLAE